MLKLSLIGGGLVAITVVIHALGTNYLVRYLASYAEEKRRAIQGAYNPTMPALYQDKDVLAAVVRRLSQRGTVIDARAGEFLNTWGIKLANADAAGDNQRFTGQLGVILQGDRAVKPVQSDAHDFLLRRQAGCVFDFGLKPDHVARLDDFFEQQCLQAPEIFD